MYWTSDIQDENEETVSDRLLSDKRKHPLTALIGNEGIFFYLGVDNVWALPVELAIPALLIMLSTASIILHYWLLQA